MEQTSNPGARNRRVTRSMTASIEAPIKARTSIAILEEFEPLEPRPKKRRRTTTEFQKTTTSITKSIDVSTQPKTATRLDRPLSASTFGLVQERIADNLYHLVLQAILWNQTTGRQARPVFEQLIALYPNPMSLASASLSELTTLLHPIGLHNIRAARCIALGKRWCELPPSADKQYIRKKYHLQSNGEGLGWEIGHLPGVGPYALDSYRIFHRDKLRGLAQNWLGDGAAKGFEPEWKRVLPTDKELRAYLKWMWMKDGWEWDERTGNTRRAKD
ncbi:hypothetical protein MMC10_011228 [Thelotrema lepadinum]|nr:hypothetical protein [Thelotrema lepadinum]